MSQREPNDRQSSTVVATLRCWPGGRVLQAFERAFAAQPLEGDIIEITGEFECVVHERRFAPDGRLHLKLMPTGDACSWTADELASDWEAGVQLQENEAEAVLSAESAFDPGLLRRVAGDCEAGGMGGAARLLRDLAWHVEHGDQSLGTAEMGKAA